MDYSQLSDRDIDALVLQEVYGNQAKDKDIMRAWLKGEFKFTTNAVYAWPIIVANEILLNSYSGTWEASYEYEAPIGVFGTDEIITKAVEGKNPLRTAMIAFLMKQERANA